MPPSPQAPLALVTGASGGLGQAISLELARRGFQLVLHGRNPQRLAGLAARLRGLGHLPPRTVTAHFEDLGSVAAMCSDLESNTGGLDLLVNNAGTGFRANPVTTDGYRHTFQVNYLAPYLLMRRLLPLMRGRRGATILNIASAGQADLPETFGLAGEGPDAVAYGQSKLALIMATRTLAEELGEDGPRLLALHPGSMLDTELTHGLLRRMPSWVTLAWKMARPLRPTVAQSARFVAACALDPSFDSPSGTFLTRKGPGRVRRQAGDPAARRSLEAFSRAAIDCFSAVEPTISIRTETQAQLAELDPL